MVRKSLFLGLTAMLSAVLVYLVIQGRRTEKRHQQTAARPVEIVQESKPTLTRLIAPQDLAVTDLKMELSPAAPEAPQGQGLTARHQIVIRNSGQTVYRNPRLKLSYLGRGEKVLDTRIRELDEVLQPGQARSMSEVAIENIPAGTVRVAARILSADIEPAAGKSK